MKTAAPDWHGLECLEQRLLLAALYKITDLGTLGGPASWALDMNQHQQVVGRALLGPSPATERAFRWDADNGMQDLGTLDGYARSHATAINDAGQAAGTALNSVFEEQALFWAGEQLQPLGTLGGTWSRAVAISGTGQVVGTSATAETDSSGDELFHAFLWDQQTMLDLGTLGGPTSLGQNWWNGAAEIAPLLSGFLGI